MYTVGKEMLDAALDSIRRTTDECENLQGFIIYRSYGGGTGSGFTTILSERLHNEFDKCTIMEYGIYPSPCVTKDLFSFFFNNNYISHLVVVTCYSRALQHCL